MYVVENNKINIAMCIELILETKNIESVITSDFCQFKINFKQNSSTPAIMGFLRTLTLHFHNAGHSFQDECYDIFYKLSWLGITDEIKEKLSKMTIDDIEIFFNIDKEQMNNEAMEMLNDSTLGKILKSIFDTSNN